MRTTLEQNRASGQRHEGLKLASATQVVSGYFRVPDDGPIVYALETDGAAVVVQLPDVEGERWIILANIGVAGALEVVDGDAIPLLNVAPGLVATLYATKSEWIITVAAPESQPLDADLTAISNLVSTGIVRRPAADTWTAGGLVQVEEGGTGADLSATGGAGKYLSQAAVGAPITVVDIPASDIVNGEALTKTDDTNVTLTLGGTPNSALLKATSITVNWSGTLAAARLNSNVVQSVVNDTNVTGSILNQVLTLGWTSVLGAARLNPDVVQAVVNDTNITGSISLQTLTFQWSGRLALSRFVQGSALSVLGVAGNAIADYAAIVAGTDGHVLRRSGTTVGFGTIPNTSVTGLGTASTQNTGTSGANVPLLNGNNVQSGSWTVSGAVDNQSTFALSGDISPSQLTANTNDWAPTGLSTASVIRFSTDAPRNITGLTGGADGRIITLHNIGANDAVLKDESASSTAANRFALNSDVTLAADVSILLMYDSTSSRWRALGSASGGSGSAGRPLLTSNRTYYVRTDGSDSNDGLTNSSGGAFLTLQKAIDVVLTLDLGGFSVTIQVGDGTYTAGVSLSKPFVGGTVTLQGNTTTPANCIISTTSANCIFVSNGATLFVGGFKLQTTTGGNCISLDSQANCQITAPMDFGSCAATHIGVGGLSVFRCVSVNYTVSGNCVYHVYNQELARTLIGVNTVTFSGSRSASAYWLVSVNHSMLRWTSVTKSGTSTGPRYYVGDTSLLQTDNGGGAPTTYPPGNSAGTLAGDGQIY